MKDGKRQWLFDDYDCHHKIEDRKPSFVEVEKFSTEEGDPSLNIVLEGKERLKIQTFIDQWGTYIGFRIDDEERFVIAQEGGTRSFIDALIKGLEAIRDICDHHKPMPAEEVVLIPERKKSNANS